MHVYVDTNYNHHTLPICKEVMINTHLKTCSHKYSVINFSIFSRDLGLQSCLPFILIDTELKHQIHCLSSERRLGEWMEPIISGSKIAILLCPYLAKLNTTHSFPGSSNMHTYLGSHCSEACIFLDLFIYFCFSQTNGTWPRS